MDLDLKQFSQFGGRARKFMPLLVQVARQQGEKWDIVADLNQIGGVVWMNELIRELPVAEAGLGQYGFTPNTTMEQAGSRTGIDSKRVGEDAVIRYWTLRWGIARWAGRSFSDSAEINAWWAANHNLDQAVWLSDNLKITADRADHGSVQEQILLRCLLPDLPEDSYEGNWGPPPSEVIPAEESRPEKPWRVAWLEAHLKSLRLDEASGCFLLH